MNHLTAVHLPEGWQYASTSKRGGHPVGYCRDHYHGTEQEARECFAGYQRDNVVLDGQLASWSDCHECGAPTKQFAQIRGEGYAMASLCPNHLTHEHAVAALGLDGPSGDSWQS